MRRWRSPGDERYRRRRQRAAHEHAGARALHWMQDLPASETRASERAPNIIFILAGDFSINDLSVFGGGVTNGWVPTPNIDSEHDEAEEVSGAVQFKMESTPLHGACPKRFPPVSERECGTC